MTMGTVPTPQAPQARIRTSEVHGALAELDAAIDQLHGTITELNERAATVTMTGESAKTGGGDRVSYASAMAMTIADYTARVNGAKERIAELLSRLAI